MALRCIPGIYNLRLRSEEVCSFDKPQAKKTRGLSELQTSNDLNLRLYIPGIHLNAMIHIVYTILVTSSPYTKVSFTYTRVLNLNAAVLIPFHLFKRRESFSRLVAGRV